MSESVNKIYNVRVGIGRVEANYIATNPLIFELSKIGDLLICVHKDDYFKMQDGISGLLQEIIDLQHQIIYLSKILTPEIIKELRIKKLKEELDILKS